MMSLDEFSEVLDKIKPYTDFIYYHLMGEPLLNPEFPKFLELANEKGFKSCITTNGTLLDDTSDLGPSKAILEASKAVHKISISLQAQEANLGIDLKEYIKKVCEFGKAIEGKTIVSYRLWNEGGLNKNNEMILKLMKEYYKNEWKDHPTGYTIGNKVYLEFDRTFKWPGYNEHEIESDRYYCYGLKDQLGILVDGTVTCCCLDNNGKLALGNIFKEEMEDIINSKRALAILDGFKNGQAAEELCRNCDYASRFTK